MLKECPWKTKRFRQTSIVFGLSQGSCRENFHYSRHNFGWSRSDKIMNQQRKKLMTIVSNIRYLARQSLPMCEIYPYSEFFWSVFFPHLDWIGRYTVYLSAFRPNAGKYRPEKLQMRTLFMHCSVLRKLENWWKAWIEFKSSLADVTKSKW